VFSNERIPANSVLGKIFGLRKRFASVDFERAGKDAPSFIKKREAVGLWSADFFSKITDDKPESEKTQKNG